VNQAVETSAGYSVREGVADDVPRLRSLWLALYENQKANGMLVELPEDAFDRWAASLIPMLGRFACLFVVERNSELVGFLAGRIRALPSYFGGAQAGFISDVYVHDLHRRHGLGRRLVSTAMEWFRNLGISRLELQVIVNNPAARKLYKDLGWSEELLQMVWHTKQSTDV
jgi:ribosomal protein S18 acetylase RimI-like enzyme